MASTALRKVGARQPGPLSRSGVDASLELVTSEVVDWVARTTAHDLLK
jgi:hypothetical protein